MPLTVEEVKFITLIHRRKVCSRIKMFSFANSITYYLPQYQIGQLYMIARHSHEQTDSGEGVEVVENVACEDPEYGQGQYTEKRIHLSRYCMSAL